MLKTKKTSNVSSSSSSSGLLEAARKHALSRGIKPSLLVALADHESGLDPNIGTTKLDPTGTAAGAWQMTQGTAETIEPGSYPAILSGDIEVQARTAAELYRRNRASVGAGDPGAILAHWLGAGGARHILVDGIPHSTGGVHGVVTVDSAMNYIDDIMSRSAKFTYLDTYELA